MPRSVPILTGLCRGIGHAGKIAVAKTLLRAVGDRLGPLCLLLDAWTMRGSVIRAAMQRGHTVVGQVRRDTTLFALPPPRAPGRRGRSRLYGAIIASQERPSGLPSRRGGWRLVQPRCQAALLAVRAGPAVLVITILPCTFSVIFRLTSTLDPV